MKKAAIIILNYNGTEDTIACVNSILDTGCSADIIVVDNASSVSSYEQLTEQLPKNVLLIASDVNLGYAGGNNIGIKYAYDNGYEYICVLNNDTVLMEDFLSPCVVELEKNWDIAFIGPTIVNYSDGKVQSTGGSIDINRAFADCKNAGAEYKAHPRMICSDYIGGACMVFRRDIVKELGMIPESYFLFFEETEWCYRALQHGYRNICLNAVRIRHKGSVSIKKIGGLNEYMMMRNRIAFLRRNHPNKMLAFCIYLFLCFRAVLAAIIKDWSRMKWVRYYTHGWFKKVDTKKYPFLRIVE